MVFIRILNLRKMVVVYVMSIFREISAYYPQCRM